MLMQISPQMAGGLKFIMDSAGKDKDPNFDLKRELKAIWAMTSSRTHTKKTTRNTFADLTRRLPFTCWVHPSGQSRDGAQSLASLLTGQAVFPRGGILGRKILHGGPSVPSEPRRFSRRAAQLEFTPPAPGTSHVTDEAMLETFSPQQ